MIVLFRAAGSPETPAEAGTAPAGIERDLRQAAAGVGACKPVILWSGTVANTALDIALLGAMAHPGQNDSLFLYDDQAASPAARLVRIR